MSANFADKPSVKINYPQILSANICGQLKSCEQYSHGKACPQIFSNRI